MWLVVGAGPSGLAAASALLELGMDFVVYEASSDVGGLWSMSHPSSPLYEGARLITSAEMTRYRRLPWRPSSGDDYPDHHEVLAYLRQYAVYCGLREHVQFNTRVSALSYDQRRRVWSVTTNRRTYESFQGVVLCCGAQWSSRSEGFSDHATLTATDLRDPRSECAGRSVVIIGGGNTAVDIACLASQTASHVTFAPRCSRWIIPKFIDGLPSDYPLEDPDSVGSRGKRGLSMQLELAQLLTPLLSTYNAFWPRPDHLPFERTLVVSDDLLPRIDSGAISVHFGCTPPAIAQQSNQLLVLATGYAEKIPVVVNGREVGWNHFLLNCIHREFPTLLAVRPPRSNIGGFWVLEYVAALVALAAYTATYSSTEWHDVRERISFLGFDLLEGAVVQPSTDVSHFVVGACYLEALSTVFTVLGSPGKECRVPVPGDERSGV